MNILSKNPSLMGSLPIGKTRSAAFTKAVNKKKQRPFLPGPVRFLGNLFLLAGLVLTLNLSAQAQSGEALSLDGSNDVVDLGNTFGNFGTGDFTLEARVKLVSGRTYAEVGIVTKRAAGCAHGSFWELIAFGNGEIQFKVDNSSQSGSYNIGSPAQYGDGNWHHVAAVRKGTLMQLYVDGNLVAQQTTATTSNTDNTATVQIGKACGYLEGSVDEVRIWSRALSGCEVALHKDCELSGAASGLEAYYNFNQGIAGGSNTGVTSLTDASGNNRNGTLSGFALSGSSSNWVAPGGVTAGVSCATVPTSLSVEIAATPSLTITAGDNLTLTASGANSYTWSNGTQSTSLVLTNVTSATAYSVTGSISTGCSATATADIVVMPQSPTLTASASVTCVGSPISVTASCLVGTASFTASPSAGSASGNIYTFDATTPTGIYSLSATCVSSGLSSTVATLANSLTVSAAGIAQQPVASSVVCVGTSVGVPVSLTGSVVSQQWYNGSSPVASQTTTTLSLSSATLLDAGAYKLVVLTTGCGSLTTNAFSLSVSEAAAITGQPVASSVACVGGSVSVPVSVTGAGASYQWYKGSSPVASQTTTTLSLPSATTADAGSYVLVVLTTSCGSLTTNAFSLSVSEAVAITGQPVASSAVCVGKSVSVPTSVTGAGASYQWYKGSSPVASQTATTLSLPSATTADAGSYVLVVTGSCNSVTSTAFTLTVNSLPTVATSPSISTINGGQSATLTASGATSYTWNTNDTGAQLVKAPLQTTVYSVTGTDANGCSATASATVVVNCGTPIQVDAISVTQTAVLGPGNCSVSLKGYGYGTGYTITGPGGYVFSAVYRKVGSYTLNALNVKLPGKYTFTVTYSDICGHSSSDTMTYVVTGTACQ